MEYDTEVIQQDIVNFVGSIINHERYKPMTIAVTISHDQPGYHKDISVSSLNPNSGNTALLGVVPAGEKRVFHVWVDQSLIVSEIPKVQ